jgi:chromosome segregation ATPase
MEDNCRLSNLYQELHISLQKAEKDKENMTNVIEDKNMNIQNLNNKLNMQETNLKYLNEQIDDGNIMNNKLQNILKELNDKIDNYERENNDLKSNLLKEKNIRINEENLNKGVNDLLVNKEIEINNLNKKYEDILNKQRYLNNENCEIKLEIERYKNTCKILREQNNNLMNEIQNIISIQEKVQDKLIRKERIKHLLDENKNILQQSSINLDDILYYNLEAKSFV